MNSEEILSFIDTPVNLLKTKLSLMSSFEMYLQFMFLIVNDSHVFIEPFHLDVINALEKYVFQENNKRNLCLTIPVGSGKSLLVQYFITWCFARDINNTFVYVSHSSLLINKLSKEAKEIVEHPIWIKIFAHRLKKDERSKINWGFEDSKNRTGLTAGTIGGAITGLDAGNPNIERFSGALIIDDPIDVGNIRYERARTECIEYYTDKLETRRRTPQTPTILIMQRLHINDLPGYLKSVEPNMWEFVTVKALQDDGNSFWEDRFPISELHHILKINSHKFYAQYQQDPRVSGGTVIRSEWFGYYENLKDVKFRRLFFTGDTAQKKKEHNDFTVFCAWGMDVSHLYLIEIVRGKWEAPELLVEAKKLWDKYRSGVNNKLFSGMYIEDKVSGTGLIQTLRRETKIPVFAIQRHKDKLTRVEDMLPIPESGKVLLPVSSSYRLNPIFLSECEGFARDMTHKHDDIVDNLCDACVIFRKGFTREDIL